MCRGVCVSLRACVCTACVCVRERVCVQSVCVCTWIQARCLKRRSSGPLATLFDSVRGSQVAGFLRPCQHAHVKVHGGTLHTVDWVRGPCDD